MEYNKFFKGLPEWCKQSLKEAPVNYELLLKKSKPHELLFLSKYLKVISGYGITGFGYRIFWQNGDTSIFALNKDWYGLIKNEQFNALNLDYIKNELLLAIKNNINVITRSRDKLDNQYLIELNRTSVNNGIVVYNFFPLTIEVNYFQCLYPSGRDLLLSKIPLIQTLLEECRPVFKNILCSQEFSFIKQQCLNKTERSICFQRGNSDNMISTTVTATYKGQNIRLSFTEIECLYFLKFGGTVPQIAQCVGRSASSIKDRIRGLKTKLNVQTKKELICISRNELACLRPSSHKPSKFPIKHLEMAYKSLFSQTIYLSAFYQCLFFFCCYKN